MNLPIFIMSRNRANKVHTLNSFPACMLDQVTIVISHDDDLDLYEEHNPRCRSFLQAPGTVKNYSDKFQWLLEHGAEMGHVYSRKFVIMDDDLWFSKRVGDKLLKCENLDIDIVDMWGQVEALLDDYALVGIHPRQMGHIQKLPFINNSKIICIQGVNLDLFPYGAIPTVNEFPILADVFLNCYLLSKGCANAILTSYVQDHGSCQAPGGCSLYRTPAMQRAAVEAVVERYGPHAQAVVKRPKSAKWMGDERVDLRVQWKQLYKSGGGK